VKNQAIAKMSKIFCQVWCHYVRGDDGEKLKHSEKATKYPESTASFVEQIFRDIYVTAAE
jgi:hypothetical protein